VSAPLYGVVLAGGLSSRMQRDKATLQYNGSTQLERAFALAARHTQQAFVSVRADQSRDPARAAYPLLIDAVPGEGPIVGIRSALERFPQAAWLVLACDLPFLSDAVLEHLLRERDPARLATAFLSASDGKPEPLCAVWEPAAAAALAAYQAEGGHCPRKFLMRSATHLIAALDAHALDNINTPDEYASASAALGAKHMPLRIQYFALLREQAGRSEESVHTSAATPAALYQELKSRHGFTLTREQLKVAVNSEFSDWSRPLSAGDAVVFIPPVAGG
jgi:molybdopterin-guanine dinucleotide biosynthesis protein A